MNTKKLEINRHLQQPTTADSLATASTSEAFTTRKFNFETVIIKGNQMPVGTLTESMVFLLSQSTKIQEIVHNSIFIEYLSKLHNKSPNIEQVYLPFLSLFNLLADTFLNSRSAINPASIEIDNIVSMTNASHTQTADTRAAVASVLTRLIRVLGQSTTYAVGHLDFYGKLRGLGAEVGGVEKGEPESVLSQHLYDVINELKFSEKAAGKLITRDDAFSKGSLNTIKSLIKAFCEDYNISKEPEAPTMDILKLNEFTSPQLIKPFSRIVLRNIASLGPEIPAVVQHCYVLHLDNSSEDIGSQAYEHLLEFTKSIILSRIKSGFGLPLPFVTEQKIQLYKHHVSLTRLEMGSNCSFGIIDLSELDFVNQKASPYVDIIRPIKGGHKINKFKVEIVKDFQLRDKHNFQDKAYFKVPKLVDLVRKLNESMPLDDLLGDYDIIGIYETQDKKNKGREKLAYLSLEDRLNPIINQQFKLPRLQLYMCDNPRLIKKKCLKVVYTSVSNTQSSEFFPMVFTPEDNEESVDSLISHLCKHHLGANFASKDSVSSKKDAAIMLESLHFSLGTNQHPQLKYPVKNFESGLLLSSSLLQVYEVLYKETYGVDPVPDADLQMLHLVIEGPINIQYGEGAFVTCELHKHFTQKLELKSNLSDLLDYLIHNHRFDGPKKPDRIDRRYSSHPILDQLPTPLLLLPANLLFVVSRINNMLELTPDFKMLCVDKALKRHNYLTSSRYELNGFICSRKNSSPANQERSHYPVLCRDSSKAVGYLPNEVKSQLFKVKREYADVMFYERCSFTYFN